MDFIAGWFHRLYETTGLNFTVFYDPYDWHRYLGGLATTVLLCVVTIFLSLAIGAVGALLQSAPSRLAHNAVHVFVVVFRNTPPLVQLFFFYFGIGAILPASQGADGMRLPVIGNLQWAIISLSLFAGAFNVEIFRSGIEAIPKTSVEAAEALGYTRFKAYVHVILPLALRVCLPALNNNLVNLVKTTTLAYAIAVPETLYEVKQIWGESQNVMEMMLVLFITYGVLVGILVWIMHGWERLLRIPGYGR